MNYKEMVAKLKQGRKGARKGWAEDVGDRYIFWIEGKNWNFATETVNTEELRPNGFVAEKTISNRVQPFFATMSDRQAQDWGVLE